MPLSPLLKNNLFVYDEGMKKLVIANWKSHKNLTTIEEWMDVFISKLGKSLIPGKVDISIAPSAPFLSPVANDLDHGVTISSQDVSPFPPGKYTGASNAKQLASLGVKYAIVGHSERRRYFHEDHAVVANKVTQCLEAGITPVVCVDDEYIAAQAAAITPEEAGRCVVAYEALSAIGTGNNMDVAHVAEVTADIKELFGPVPVLYGGSVSAENVAEYKAVSDGWLVGTASLEVDDFMALVTVVAGF